ncbi:MAG: hypothetical protein HYY35_10980 [Deltaproteobacteria bacterium]|nr:hypothetical protein [Deltaproteobacteria bacterium]
MKLLLFGSLAVLLGVVVWAALDWAIHGVVAPAARMQPPPPVFGFVNVARQGDGTRRSKAGVWQTSTGPEDCAEVIQRRKREEKKRIADLLISATDPAPNREDQNACAAFQLGEVEDGARVEILGDCGGMARIRILSGSLAGRRGCIESDRLSAEVTETHSSW